MAQPRPERAVPRAVGRLRMMQENGGGARRQGPRTNRLWANSRLLFSLFRGLLIIRGTSRKSFLHAPSQHLSQSFGSLFMSGGAEKSGRGLFNRNNHARPPVLSAASRAASSRPAKGDDERRSSSARFALLQSNHWRGAHSSGELSAYHNDDDSSSSATAAALA